MAQMFGFIGNRSDLGARVLARHADVLRFKRQGREALGWGLGFYQSSEVLLRRRPIDEREVIDLTEAAENLRTDILIGHVRHATVGDMRTENTHPFRYRMWLFAKTGTIAGFSRLRTRLLESQPEFLRRNVRGDTDSELFFYLFLSFLHDAGHLNDHHVAAEHVRASLRASISLVDRLSAEEGHQRNAGDILVTNGEYLIGVHRNGRTALRELRGKHDVEELFASGEDAGAAPGEKVKVRIPSVESTRFALIAAGLTETPIGWTPVEPGTMVTLTRSEPPSYEAL